MYREPPCLSLMYGALPKDVLLQDYTILPEAIGAMQRDCSREGYLFSIPSHKMLLLYSSSLGSYNILCFQISIYCDQVG